MNGVFFPGMTNGITRKYALRRVLSVLFIAQSLIMWAQEPEYHVVQAVVEGLRSPGQCAQVDIYLRAQADVIVARTDYNTRNVMIQVPHFSTFGEQHLRDLFQSLGLEIRCYRRLPLNSSLYKPLDPRDCTEMPAGLDQ